MNKKFQYLIISILIIVKLVVKQSHQSSSKKLSISFECVVKNIDGLYLYPSNDDETDSLLMLNSIMMTNDHMVYVYPLNQIENVNQIKWSLVPVYHKHNNKIHFYIKSNYYQDKYLCASNIQILLNTRRKIYLGKLDEMTSRNECLWRIEKSWPSSSTTLDNNKILFKIWNVYYNEPLYTASSLLSTSQSGRNVYTWYGEPDSSQFNWSLQCVQHK